MGESSFDYWNTTSDSTWLVGVCIAVVLFFVLRPLFR